MHTVCFSYGADSTAILAVPAKIPILLNDKIVGSQTVPAASKITILRKDLSTGKILIKTSLGETWVAAAFIKMMDLEPPPAPAADHIDPPATPSQESPAPEMAVQTVVQGSPTISEKFTLSFKETDVEVRRFGQGKTGIIFFNNSGPMDDQIARAISEYSPLLDKGCSLFLWSYPEVAPFDDVQATIESWMGGTENHLDFTGVATAVVDKTQLKRSGWLLGSLFFFTTLFGGCIAEDALIPLRVAEQYWAGNGLVSVSYQRSTNPLEISSSLEIGN